MDFSEIKSRLSKTPDILQTILRDISEDQAKWKPSEQKWSIVEVLNHLLDEEKSDFRKRIDLTLNHPGEEWPSFEPEKWAAEKKYNKRNLDDSLDDFIKERLKSIIWLEGLHSADWDLYYDHPKAGKLAAGDLLAAWLAHDYLHLRQIFMLMAEYVEVISEPYSTRYARP